MSGGEPCVTFVIPVYNGSGTVARCIRSALRQRGVEPRVVVVDHGSTDGTPDVVESMGHPGVTVIRLERRPTDLKCPSRPLNTAVEAVLRDADGPEALRNLWVLRLDSDDFLVSDTVVAEQLSAGGHRKLVMATLVFFDPAHRTGYEYGPREGNRTLATLPGKDLYAVAHHANAVRGDFLAEAVRRGPLYDEKVETGEDLGATCALVRALSGQEHEFAFVPSPYCYKALTEETITGSLPARRVWSSHRRLLRAYPEITVYAIVRGLAELVLGRLVNEPFGRRSLQHLAGRNGAYRAVDFADVAARMDDLAQRSSAGGP